MDAQLRTKAVNHLIGIIKRDNQEQRHGHKRIKHTFTIDADATNPIEHGVAATTMAPHKQHFEISTMVTKMFDGTAYKGTIVLFGAKEGYCKIVYKDNNSEELDETEIEDLLNTSKEQSHPAFTTQDILQLEMSLDIFGPSTTIKMSTSYHTDLGFIFFDSKETPTIKDCKHGTPAHAIRSWRSRFCFGTIRAVNGKKINTKQQFQTIIEHVEQTKITCLITIAQKEISNIHTAKGVPKLHFNQLNAMANHLHVLRTDQNTHWDPITPSAIDMMLPTTPPSMVLCQ